LLFRITSKVLTQQLRELEAAGVLSREAYAETPRRVEYSVTPYGATLIPITELMCDWGKTHMPKFQFGLLNLGGLRVLIVSEPEVSNGLRSPLELRNVQLMVATSAQEAMILFQQNRPNVLVIDITMDNNEGLKTIAKMRDLEKQKEDLTPAIALTTLDSSDRRQAIRAGFQVHLIKPVELAELVAAFASLTCSSSYLTYES
jgi:CheY-like chemotaxis protein